TNPTLTATITGYVNGDNASVVSGTPALSTVATQSSAVGTYAITAAQGTLSAANYTFGPFVPGTLSVANVAPSITGITLPASPAAIKTTVTAGVTFTDPGTATGETYTATFDWGDGTAPTPSPSGTASPLNASHPYAAAGVYTIKVTVTDSNGGSSGQASSIAYSPAYVVIYDPSAGYVTGGGWINSPAGACNPAAGVQGVCGSDVTGHANFGFSS